MAIEIRVAVRKLPRHGLVWSGDQAQVVERARGGVSLIMADGQGNGEAARRTALLVANRCANLISEGARDGPTARAVHDLLYAQRGGKVSATLVIVSADLEAQALLVSQNGPDVVLVKRQGIVERLMCPYGPIGVEGSGKPFVHEFPLAEGTIIVALSDGVLAPDRWSTGSAVLDGIGALVRSAAVEEVESLAQAILDLSHHEAKGRPRDDMTVGVFGICGGTVDAARVFSLHLPA
jgi:serine phosphatase RsbU (regulator of sigma subunit)